MAEINRNAISFADIRTWNKYWMSYFDVTMLTDERSLGINAETIHYKTIEDQVGGSPESLQFILWCSWLHVDVTRIRQIIQIKVYK